MKVICISGKAQHGKDTAAGFAKEVLEKSGNKVLITHYGDLVKYVCEKYFGWDGVKDEYGRGLLQWVGTDVVRNQDSDFWVDFISSMLWFFEGYWDYVLIPDTRFPNEIEGLSGNIGVIHARIVRKNYESTLKSEHQMHISETALDGYPAEYILENNGTLEELEETVKTFVEEILHEE